MAHRSQIPPMSPALRWLLAAAMGLLALGLAIQMLPGKSHPLGKDFNQYYVAGKLAVRGQLDSLYFVDIHRALTEAEFPGTLWTKTAREFGFTSTGYWVYQPWVAWMYVPLVPFSPYMAFVLAYFACAALLVFGVWLSGRDVPRFGPEAALIAFAPFAISPPVAEAMGAAQASIPFFAMLVLFARALHRDRPWQAGLWWALMTGLKMFPVYFGAYLLLRRQWRALVAGAVWGAALMGVNVLCSGWAASVRFVRMIVEHLPYNSTFDSNQSVTGWALRQTYVADPHAWTIIRVPGVLGIEIKAFILLTLLIAGIAIARRKDEAPNPWMGPLSLGLFTIWTVMVAPFAWMHHLVALAYPIVVAAARLLDDDRHRLRDGLLWTAGVGLVLAHWVFIREIGRAHV